MQTQTQEPERIEPQAPPSAREAFRAVGAALARQATAAQEAAHRERFEDWAARERQRLFSRQLEARDVLHLAHERIRELWANREGESFDRRRREASAEMRAIEERQAQTGLKGWVYRVSGQAEAEREELDVLRVRKHDLTREQNTAWAAMEAPLRAEAAALKARQEVELQQLEQRLAERWEQSWSRARDRANENARAPKSKHERRAEQQSHGRGGRSRSREP